MEKSKWRELNNIVEVLTQAGRVEHLGGGLIEETHKRFKTQYRHNSWKMGTAMRENLIRECISAAFDNMRNEKRKQKG